MTAPSGGSNTQTGDLAVIDSDSQLKEPPSYAVFLLNDNYTTFEFVVEVLQKFFKKGYDEAAQITVKVHKEGKGLAGIFSQQIAETKAVQVSEYARSHQFPLRATTEPV